jgi:uncharacterized protein DUF6851/vanadium-dependent haloperoxidase-like protein
MDSIMFGKFTTRPVKKLAPRNLVCWLLLLLGVSGTGFAQVVTQVGARGAGFAQENVVIQWNNAALQTIRYMRPGVTSISRSLAIVHTCIFDAWSAYDNKAIATIPGSRRRRPARERTEENKKKAISYAAYRCLVDLYPSEIAKFDAVMALLQYDPADTSLDPARASGIGNLAAAVVINFRHHDGSNQLGDLHPGAYSDYTGYQPANDPEHIRDGDHWQPLRTPIPDGGYSGRYLVQKFLTPHWGLVTPFALKSGSEFRPTAPATQREHERFMAQAEALLRLSADLTDEQKMIAEYWADGPASETPPGHWCLFAQYVSLRDHHSVDDDVKMFFIMTNAVMDAGIAAWDAKRFYDSVRPVTAIHLLFIGSQVRAWGGRFKGTQTISGENWQPYQPIEMASTPPFPEFVSGHSTFSAAAAEALKRFTGNDSFGASVTFLKGRSKVEPGLTPREQVTLTWPTFMSAAEQAGMSRRYCGIHFEDGDFYGRQLGRKVAARAWQHASDLIHGKG